MLFPLGYRTYCLVLDIASFICLTSKHILMKTLLHIIQRLLGNAEPSKGKVLFEIW